MTGASWLRIGAISGALAVAFGAFGAHGMTPRQDVLDAMGSTSRQAVERRLANYETGARYHMYHALALLAVATVAGEAGRRAGSIAGWCFLLGTLGFSGSLYAIALGGPTWLGMIVTPLGGVLFIVGWIALAISAGTRGRPAASVVD